MLLWSPVFTTHGSNPKVSSININREAVEFNFASFSVLICATDSATTSIGIIYRVGGTGPADPATAGPKLQKPTI